jgi:hypothetical protein
MLNEIEIKQIHTYCKSVGIKYFDVELELVDHMAEWISDKMQTQNMYFDDALKQMKSSFTKEEFLQIVEEKRNLVAQKLKRLYKQAFLDYFKFPQIALTFFLIALSIYVGRNKNPEFFPGVAMYVMNFIVLTYAWGRATIVRKNKEDLKYTLLSYKELSSFFVFFIIPSIFYAILNFCRLFEAPISIFAYNISVYLFPFFVIACLAFRKVNIDMHHKIRELYPMAFSS